MVRSEREREIEREREREREREIERVRLMTRLSLHATHCIGTCCRDESSNKNDRELHSVIGAIDEGTR